MKLANHELDRIHRTANTLKAVQTLLGILQGLTADRQLNSLEILFLSVWLKENQFLQNDPDTVDILDCINDIQRTAHPSRDQINDLKELITQIIEYRQPEIGPDPERAKMNTLLGIIQGIMADQQLNDTEIHGLNNWLNINAGETWPASLIKAKVNKILEDGIVTNSERQDLFTLLLQCGCNQFTSTGAADATTLCLGTSEPKTLTVEQNRFCFTGTFLTGNREYCHSIITKRGGAIAESVTQKLNYLVLGAHPSRDWITSSYGRKIQRAIEMQQKGHPIQLLTEHTWANAIGL